MHENIAAIVKIEPAKRTKKQTDELTKLIKSSDTKLKQLQTALNNAKKPLPVDAGEKQRRATLAKASIAVPIDADLLEIRRVVYRYYPDTIQRQGLRLRGVDDDIELLSRQNLCQIVGVIGNSAGLGWPGSH